MPTTSFELNRETWVLVSTGPCFVENPTKHQRFAVKSSESVPSVLDEDFHIIVPKEDYTYNDSEPLYARALSPAARVVVSSDSSSWAEGVDVYVSRVVSDNVLTEDNWDDILSFALNGNSNIVFDTNVSVANPLAVSSSVSIEVRHGVTVSLIPDGLRQYGVTSSDNLIHHTGVFVFRPGSEGSILSVDGQLDAGLSEGETVHTGEFFSYGVLMVGLTYDNENPISFRGNPSVSNATSAAAAIHSPFAGEPWSNKGLHGPSLPNTSETAPENLILWVDDDIIYSD